MFHFLSSSGCKHIPSHKEQTENAPVVELDSEKVFISCVDNKAMPLDGKVEVGTSVKVGTLLGVRKDFGLPVYSPVSGTVTAIVKKTSSLIGRPVDHFEITNDHKYEEQLLDTLKDNASPEDAVELLKNGAIVGLGGAGFPTFIKFKASDIDTILVNAVECEPFITTDFIKGTQGDVKFVLKTLAKLLDVFSISQAMIACKKERVELIESLTSAINEFGDPRITLKTVKSVYPAGWERLLIELALGRKYDKLPAEAHVIVDNYQTIESIGHLFFEGKICSKKQITVSGEVADPHNVIAPVGTLVKDLIEKCGGYTVEKAVLVNGGPMCGGHLKTDDVAITLPNNAITVLVQKTIAENACLRCGECTAHCPRQLQPCEINFAAKRGDYDRCYELGVFDCINCGLCSFVCPSHIAVSDGIQKAKLMTNLKSAKAKASKK